MDQREKAIAVIGCNPSRGSIAAQEVLKRLSVVVGVEDSTFLKEPLSTLETLSKNEIFEITRDYEHPILAGGTPYSSKHQCTRKSKPRVKNKKTHRKKKKK